MGLQGMQTLTSRLGMSLFLTSGLILAFGIGRYRHILFIFRPYIVINFCGKSINCFQKLFTGNFSPNKPIFEDMSKKLFYFSKNVGR